MAFLKVEIIGCGENPSSRWKECAKGNKDGVNWQMYVHMCMLTDNKSCARFSDGQFLGEQVWGYPVQWGTKDDCQTPRVMAMCGLQWIVWWYWLGSLIQWVRWRENFGPEGNCFASCREDWWAAFPSHGQDKRERNQGLLTWLCGKYCTQFLDVINVGVDMVEPIT